MSRFCVRIVVNDLDDLKYQVEQLEEEQFELAAKEENNYYSYDGNTDCEVEGNYS